MLEWYNEPVEMFGQGIVECPSKDEYLTTVAMKYDDYMNRIPNIENF